MKTTTLTLVDGVRVVVPDSLALMTPYVLREQGDWFEDDIRFVRALLEPGDAVIDIGANHGVYTLSMAHAVGPSGRVWAYEPASGVRGFLQQSVVENDFEARVKVEGKALSNRRGEALLSINIQPELNTLNADAAGGEQESVPLTSLDDELATQGWADIALMKMDAEGEEGRILEGGTGFFAALSPLVLFEIKAGVEAQLGLVDAFGRLGYGCYRLLPGLGLLMPFDPGSPVDAYLLNLYACKPDRARRLIERGLLCGVTCAVMDAAEQDRASWGGKPPAGAWRRVLEAHPYATALRSAWRKREPVDARVDEALSLYARAHDAEQAPPVRVASLRRCQALLRVAQREQPSSVRRATLARVDFELGERAAAVSAVGALAQEITRSGQVDLSEPFLPPLARFDTLPAGTEPIKWFLASVLEACETWGAFSSFFMGAASQRSLQSLASLGFASPEVTRRLALVQQRYGAPAGTSAPTPAVRTAPAVVPGKPGPAGSARKALANAQGKLAAGDVAAAEAALMPLLDDPATRPEALYLLAVAAVMAGRVDDATARALDAVAAAPVDPRCQFALGRAHKLAGRLPEAVAAYRCALDLDPGYVEAQVSLGIALKHSGDIQAAIACYERALAHKPGFAAASVNLAYAKAALAERDAEQGADELPTDDVLDETARAASADPSNATLQFNLGLLMRRARRSSEAVAAFNRALGLKPTDVGYCLHFGHELVASGQQAAAIELFRRWLGMNPPAPPVMRSLADNLARKGGVSEALQWGERALALDPDPVAYLQLCGTYQQSRRLQESMAAGRRAIEMSAGQWKMYSIPLMVSNYLLEDPAPILLMHAEFGQALERAMSEGRARRQALPLQRRLRVAYLSSDFVHHSVASFLGPLLERHDKSRFEVYCFYNRGVADSMTEYLKGLGHHWVQCEHLSDKALARRIENEGIDILVDLSGHTAGNRIQLFALAPAPMQVAYLGYPTVTGVRSIDFRITDAVIDPGDIPGIGSETPLCLPQSMFCYRPPGSPPIGPPPSLATGHITFGSFNNHAKISDRCLGLWAEVLKALPASRLLLKSAAAADPANRAELLRFMAERGIAESRVEVRSQIESREEHLNLYNSVDVALDPFPYNGATTTCEALWMGVPVVTRTGATHTSRMGASILAAAGQPGWVTRDDHAYLELAQALAHDVALRAAWRSGARQQLRASALCDEAGFTAAFEAALQDGWARRCASPVTNGNGRA